MWIVEIMSTTASRYNAKHTLFNQGFYDFVGNREGVCMALCKVWLKSPDKTAAHKFKDYVSGNTVHISGKQTKYSTQKQNGDTPRRMHADSNSSCSLACYRIMGKEANFWVECVTKMTFFTTQRRNLIISIHGHALASCTQGERFYFFDPNGGIMDFDDGVSLSCWLTKEFPNADSNGYNNIRLVTVYNFTPK
jgi:hypothetical protein